MNWRRQASLDFNLPGLPVPTLPILANFNKRAENQSRLLVIKWIQIPLINHNITKRLSV